MNHNLFQLESTAAVEMAHAYIKYKTLELYIGTIQFTIVICFIIYLCFRWAAWAKKNF